MTTPVNSSAYDLIASGQITDPDESWHLSQYKDILLRGKGVPKILPIIEAEMLRKNVESVSTRDTAHIHPSEMSKDDWCPRSTYYRIAGTPEDTDTPSTYSLGMARVYEEGHEIHRKWQHWAWDAGVLQGVFRCFACHHIWYDRAPSHCPRCERGRSVLDYREVPVFDDEHRILGHTDGELHHELLKGTVPWEVKSVGVGTLRFERPDLYKALMDKQMTVDDAWKAIRAPFPTHRRQGMLYCHCLGRSRIHFIYEWKPTQAVKEFVIRPDPTVLHPLLESCKKIVRALDSGVPPRRPLWTREEGPESKACKACPYRGTCWKEQLDGAKVEEGQAAGGEASAHLAVVRRLRRGAPAS
jgi:hypothetical protein